MEKVLKALQKGHIIAIGGSVYSIVDMSYLTNTTDLYYILKDINKSGHFRVKRLDAGGSPTWGIV